MEQTLRAPEEEQRIMRAGTMLITAAVAAMLAMPLSGTACTLFGAAGDGYVKDGGTILVKNRDWTPPQWQELRLVAGDGYRYYGLFAGDKDKMALKGGVNEKGLAVFSASASAIPRKERQEMEGAGRSALKELLTTSATVEEALKHTDVFKGPKFLMLADAHQVAYVEVGDGGKFQVRTVDAGTLAHTNHYLTPELAEFNRRIGVSSRTRYERIGELLAGTRPLTLDDMLRFSRDSENGPSSSIWRTGSAKDREETLATFAVRLKEGTDPQIYVKVRHNPDDRGKEEVVRLTGSELFSGKKTNLLQHSGGNSCYAHGNSFWSGLWERLCAWWHSLWA